MNGAESRLPALEPDLIGRVLGPAVQLWLRSQTEHLGELQVAIAGRNRQLLSGYIPQVSLTAQAAVYQGLHLEAVTLTGENIRVNLGQLLRGRPLQLLEPVMVRGELALTAAGLQASLASPLLAGALRDLVALLTQAPGAPTQITWQQVDLAPGRITLRGQAALAAGDPRPVSLETGLSLASPNQLCLAPLSLSATLPGKHPEAFTLDLGAGVAFEDISLRAQGLHLQGAIRVQPEPPEAAAEA